MCLVGGKIFEPDWATLTTPFPLMWAQAPECIAFICVLLLQDSGQKSIEKKCKKTTLGQVLVQTASYSTDSICFPETEY